MLQPHVMPSLDRWAPYYGAPMLMLGACGSNVPAYPRGRDYFARWVGDDYADMDLDAADLRCDLNGDIGRDEAFATVVNLGTIEHVWNAHNAWANALRMVRTGGHLLTLSPVAGYVNHGLHVTSAPAIRAFVAKNGFEIVADFTTKRPVGDNLWLAARKLRHIAALADYEPAWQIYEDGRKVGVR
jgi:SAM-dependent methyltransferase